MNYLTKYYGPGRIVPSLKLNLPLMRVIREPRYSILPLIINGKLFNAEYENRRLICRDEIALETTTIWENERLVSGWFCADETSFFVSDEDAQIYKVSTSTFDVSEAAIDINYDDCSVATPVKYYASDKESQNLTSIERSTLKTVWKFVPKGYVTNFSLAPEKVIVHDPDANLYCLDDRDGKVIWHKTPDDWQPFQLVQRKASPNTQDFPKFFEDRIIFTSESGHILAVSLATGELIWCRHFGYGGTETAVDHNGLVYFVIEGHLGIIDARTGEVRSHRAIEYQQGMMTRSRGYRLGVTDTHVFCLGEPAVIMAINKETAKVDWYDDLGDSGGYFAICNNRLYINTGNLFYIYEGVGGYCPD